MSKVKRLKEKSKQKDRRRKERHAYKLLALAANNETKKLEKLLNKHSDIDVNVYDASGFTALHQVQARIVVSDLNYSQLVQAARFGHDEAAELLLRCGADVKAEDFKGNTPAHLAAFRKHTTTVTMLMQARGAPAMHASNQAGVSLHEAIQMLIESRASEPTQATARSDIPEDTSSSLDSEEEWRQKLELGREYDLDAAQYEFDSYADPGIYERSNSSFCFEPGGMQDEDTYAQQMWEAMNRRKKEPQKPSAFTAEFWGDADTVDEGKRKAREERDARGSAAKRRKEAADQAKANSRRILDEEEAKDRAWRQAVLQGDLGARRATYEAKWHIFASSKDAIVYSAVPWLMSDQEDARAIVLYGTAGQSEERKRLRFELMRWHPDKFQAKFAGRIQTSDRDQILDRVKTISQMLNSIAK